MPLNMDAVNAAIEKVVADALAQDAVTDAAEIAAVRAEAQKQIADALAADAAQDAIVLMAKDAEIATLKARIAELEASPPEEPPVEPPTPPPPLVPSVSIGGASLKEGDSGTSNLVFVVRLSAATTVDVSIDYVTAGGTAQAGSDFIAKSGTLVIPAGQVQGSISIAVVGDLTVEPDETFAVNIGNPVRCMLGNSSAIGSIINNDVQPPPTGDFNPRTMTREQVAAVTGLRVAASELTVRSGTTNITQAGVYERMDYKQRTTIAVNGGVVTFRNCRFKGDQWANVINIPENFLANQLRFEYCDFQGSVNGLAGANLYIYRCVFTGWDNAVNFWGPGDLVECFIHSPKDNAGSAHFDGIECNGGGNINILRSWVENPFNQTAALMFNNEFGALHDILVEGNYLAGGGYTIYFDTSKANRATTNCRVINNTIRSGSAGHAALYNSGVQVNAAGGNLLLPRA